MKPKQFAFKAFDNEVSVTTNFSRKSFIPANSDSPREIYTREQVESKEKLAHDNGYKSGYEKGLEEGKQLRYVLDQTLATLLNSVESSLHKNIDYISEITERETKDIARIGIKVAQKIIGNVIGNDQLEPVAKLASQCVELLRGHKDNITVFVNPESVEPLREKIQAIDVSGKNALIIIEGNQDILKGDCKIRWPGGGAELNQEEIWKRMEELIQKSF